MRLFLERHFEMLDRLAVAATAVVLFVYGHYVDHDAMVLGVLGGNRAAVYGTVARLFATVFGFGLTATSIVLAFAKAIVERSGVGADADPDFVAISFSSLDFVGHEYGPETPEFELPPRM